MDAAPRRPQLPALSYLDIEHSPKSESNGFAPRSATAQDANRTSATSPTHPQSFAAPSPTTHGHPASTSAPAWSSINSESRNAAEPRREDEHEGAKPTARHSLPSLSEALGVDSQSAYATSKASIPPPITSASASSPSPTFRRSYGSESSQSNSGYSRHSTYQHSSFRRDSAEPQTYPSDPMKPAYPSSRDSRPPLHLQTSQPARFDRIDRYTTSPRYEQSPSRSSASMAPPSVPYGYSSYQQRYSEPTATPAHSVGPIYQPSSQYAPPQASTSLWRIESAPHRPELDDHSASSSTYGESVKRHLDLFDLETALNEISQTSGIVSDFSRRYSERMHQTARATPSLATLPSLVEVDDMMSKSRIQLDALSKIREVIIAEQAAYEQQVADQRQQAKIYRESQLAPPPPPDSHGDAEDVKGTGGFANGEPKKRRGRAAPPGRCHSCNRAETPEWRRGPDGARTLCNACGLHYAKLTRKQSNANKSANVGSSNLRPKESA